MMRMFKMELTVFGQYLRQLAFSILFMACLLYTSPSPRD